MKSTPIDLTLRRLTITFGLLLSLAPPYAVAATYQDRLAEALMACRSIDPKEFSTGLFLNPEGYRSYYKRSACFQETAIRFRNPSLCSEVKRRYALLSSSWGYSPDECRRLTQLGIESDRNSLEEIKRNYLAYPIRLSDFQIDTNGNGRDFDIVPSFTDGYAHAYDLRFEVLDAAGGNAVVIVDQSSRHLEGTSTNLSIYVRQDELRRRFPSLSTSQRYFVRATLELNVGVGGEWGWWSDEFVERVFPSRERTSVLEREVIFSTNARRIIKY